MAFGEDYSVSEYAKEYKKEHPVYAPQGSVTPRQVVVFTEEEVRDLPTWEESINDGVARGELQKGRHLISDSTTRIDPEGVAKVSNIMIKVREERGDVYYYELDPVKGGKKGTEVDMEKEGLSAPALPPVNLPNVKLPKFTWPQMKFPEFGISSLAKGGIGLVLLFIAGIIVLIALGYSGLGGSVGRVGEKEYQRKRK